MRFFEAIDMLKKPKGDYRVFGLDHLGFSKEIWSGNDFEEAKKIAWDAKNRFYDTTIKYKGQEIPKAGRLTPRAPYNF